MASASITVGPANTTSTALLPSVTVSGLTYSSPPTPIPGTRIISSRDKDWTVYTLAGPLTTAISATASSCRQTWLLETVTGSLVLIEGTSRFTEGLQCTSGLGAIPQGCMPGNNQELFATGAFSTGADSNATRISVIPYFSPATGCPEGYATACTTTLPSGFPPKPTEDIYACCLPGHACVSDSCFYAPKAGETIKISSCDGRGNATSLVVGSDFEASVRSLPIRIVVPRESVAAAPPPTPALATSTQAAIGVSVALAVGIIFIVSFLLVRIRRRKAARMKQNASSKPPPEDMLEALHEADSSTKVTRASELQAQAASEEGKVRGKEAAELPDLSFIAELPDSEIPGAGDAQPPSIIK